VTEGAGDASLRLQRVTAGITLAAFAFYLFFQLSKSGPIGAVNPFGSDPYDAVGSIAIQIALLVGILTYARSLRLRGDGSPAARMSLILRGDWTALSAILVTLISDTIAELFSRLPPSGWGSLLRLELALMYGISILCVVVLIKVYRQVPHSPPPPDLTPADGIDDLWMLVRVPVSWFSASLPAKWVEWVERFECDRLFARVKWISPRLHPWRFTASLGLLAGVGLVLAQLQEGFPPSLAIGLLVAGIFISVELSATLVGFATLGGYLGLRPALKGWRRNRPNSLKPGKDSVE
jgi:hypothetical protein